MQIVKLDAIDSTNAYLKRTMQDGQLEDYTVVQAKEQTSGRGQQGTSWVSEPGKNLIFSVFKKFDGFYASNHFYLNIIVSLAIYRTLKNLHVPNLSIKWPNDIMSGTTKICGILIETILAGRMVKSAIIGVGLNANQTNYKKLPNVSSLKLLLERTFDLDKVLKTIMADLKYSFPFINTQNLEQLRKEYERHLFMKDIQVTFELPDGEIVKGQIAGISKIGKLVVIFEGSKAREFGFKEIKMHY